MSREPIRLFLTTFLRFKILHFKLNLNVRFWITGATYWLQKFPKNRFNYILTKRTHRNRFRQIPSPFAKSSFFSQSNLANGLGIWRNRFLCPYRQNIAWSIYLEFLELIWERSRIKCVLQIQCKFDWLEKGDFANELRIWRNQFLWDRIVKT